MVYSPQEDPTLEAVDEGRVRTADQAETSPAGS